MSGSPQSAARLTNSQTRPVLTPPSPKKPTATRRWDCSFMPIAAPMASPRPAPTIPFDPRNRRSASTRCMLPPRPPLTPVALPNNSAMTDRGLRPLARAWWWLRCVPETTSWPSSAAIVPTATASWPSEEWIPPGILPASDNRTDSPSKYLINSMPSSHCRRCSLLTSSGRDGDGATSPDMSGSRIKLLPRCCPGHGLIQRDLEGSQDPGCVVSVEVAVVDVERGGERRPDRDLAVDGDRTIGDRSRGQQELLPGRDDPGERVHLVAAEIGQRGHRPGRQVPSRHPALARSGHRGRPGGSQSFRPQARNVGDDGNYDPVGRRDDQAEIAGALGLARHRQREGPEQEIGGRGRQSVPAHRGEGLVSAPRVDLPDHGEVRDRPPRLRDAFGDHGPEARHPRSGRGLSLRLGLLTQFPPLTREKRMRDPVRWSGSRCLAPDAIRGISRCTSYSGRPGRSGRPGDCRPGDCRPGDCRPGRPARPYYL